MDNESVSRSLAPRDRLADLHRCHLPELNQPTIVLMTSERGSHLLSEIRCSSHRLQMNALPELSILIQCTPFSLSHCPLHFVPDIIDLFNSKVIDNDVRTTLFRVIALMCEKSRDLISAFVDCPLYH
jgi:hypothetical protein